MNVCKERAWMVEHMTGHPRLWNERELANHDKLCAHCRKTHPGLLAAYGETARAIHLVLADYQPGRKARSMPSTMCGTYSAIRATLIPFVTALELERTARPPLDPRPMVADRRWCAVCIGRAVDRYDIYDPTLDLIRLSSENT